VSAPSIPRERASTAPARSRSFDPTAPFTIAMALVLALLVLLPLFWLAVTSLTDDARHFTLRHFRTLRTWAAREPERSMGAKLLLM